MEPPDQKIWVRWGNTHQSVPLGQFSFRFDTRNVTAREPWLLFLSHGYGEHLVPYYNQLGQGYR